jgi:hypothetical protein
MASQIAREYRIAAFALMLAASSVEAHADTITLDSRATYLRIGSDPGALDTVPIQLIALGLVPGDLVRLTRFGDFDCGAPCGDVNIGMIAVFSASDTLLAADQIHRVSAAIEAGADFVTAVTFYGALATDIPQDFAVPGAGVTLNVPAGATHLFIAARDILYQDNTDPDRDFAVGIEEVTSSVPEPATLFLLVPAAVALVRRLR